MGSSHAYNQGVFHLKWDSLAYALLPKPVLRPDHLAMYDTWSGELARLMDDYVSCCMFLCMFPLDAGIICVFLRCAYTTMTSLCNGDFSREILSPELCSSGEGLAGPSPHASMYGHGRWFWIPWARNTTHKVNFGGEDGHGHSKGIWTCKMIVILQIRQSIQTAIQVRD